MVFKGVFKGVFRGFRTASSMFRLLSACPLLALLLAAAPLTAAAADENPVPRTLFHEEFDDLQAWKPLKFPKIPEMSSYSSETEEDATTVRASSSASASGMVWKGEFNVYEYPQLRWRWKVSNIYEKGNALAKEGDDYPLRIYVMFKYDPGDPNVKTRFKYGLARLLYGEYPPYRSLNYIWANKTHETPYLPNPYTAESVMIPLQEGTANVGQWMVETVNILDDYRKAFGTDPPSVAGLAFMNDSDNTGESSESWIDWIQIFRKTENLENDGE